MNTLVDMFKDLFGSYEPIENVASVITDADGVTTTTYAYSIDFASVCHFLLVAILFYTVCRVIGSIITNMTRSVTLR